MGIDNKIFCTAPFTTLRIESYSPNIPSRYDQFGVVFKPGCVYDPQGPIPTLDEYLSGPEMNLHRKNLCTGDQPSISCSRCWKSENLGLDSTRKQLLKKPYVSDNLGIKLLDVFFSNSCNMACFMCDAEWSTNHGEERHTLGFIPNKVEVKDNTEITLKTIDQIPELEEISFIGGEFFIFKKNLQLLDKIIERNLRARIVTNASVLTDQLLEKLSAVKHIELQISIDGIEDTYEIMRYPYGWNTLKENFIKLKTRLSNANINFHIVTQVLNCQNLHETITWANSQRTPVTFHNLVGPTCWTWKILTDSERSTLKQHLLVKQDKFKLAKSQHNWLNDLINGLDKVQFSPVHREEFIDKFSKIMTHRKIFKDRVIKQLGIFDNLANDVVNRM